VRRLIAALALATSSSLSLRAAAAAPTATVAADGAPLAGRLGEYFYPP
jgi:hypothetical protein